MYTEILKNCSDGTNTPPSNSIDCCNNTQRLHPKVTQFGLSAAYRTARIYFEVHHQPEMAEHQKGIIPVIPVKHTQPRHQREARHIQTHDVIQTHNLTQPTHQRQARHIQTHDVTSKGLELHNKNATSRWCRNRPRPRSLQSFQNEKHFVITSVPGTSYHTHHIIDRQPIVLIVVMCPKDDKRSLSLIHI